MMTHKMEEQLEEAVTKFVDELNWHGTTEFRYKEHCSRPMLVAVLMLGFRQRARNAPECNESAAERFLLAKERSIAYDIGCIAFERILEHGCHAGGNGHHVAQSFEAFMRKHFNHDE